MKDTYADAKWRRMVKARDGYKCRRCPGGTTLEVHHIFRRANQTTKTLLENGVTLCAACHRDLAHGNPAAFLEWVEESMGAEAFEQLRLKAHGSDKIVPRRLPEEPYIELTASGLPVDMEYLLGAASAPRPPLEIAAMAMVLITSDADALKRSPNLLDGLLDFDKGQLLTLTVVLSGSCKYLIAKADGGELLRAQLGLILQGTQ